MVSVESANEWLNEVLTILIGWIGNKSSVYDGTAVKTTVSGGGGYSRAVRPCWRIGLGVI